MHSVMVDGERVSSTEVRKALAAGNLSRAGHLLGRPYSISGRVVSGDRLGRKLGWPTANVLMKHNRPPLAGIFAVEVAWDRWARAAGCREPRCAADCRARRASQSRSAPARLRARNLRRASAESISCTNSATKRSMPTSRRSSARSRSMWKIRERSLAAKTPCENVNIRK